ncbi:MAG: energy transducer TonB, partial [Deltaproteobacteria bacterium]|nr:energy transducer TonB [Deltaproteobacteria bacterium]
ASLMLHAALVAVAPAGFFERPVKKNREVFDVELVAPKPRLRPKSPRPVAPPKKSVPQADTQAVPLRKLVQAAEQANHKPAKKINGEQREATVSINAADSRYGSYLAHLRHAVNAVWQYPADAQTRKVEGQLTLRFAVDRNGKLLGVTLLESSNVAVLDREALRTIGAAAPFDPFPQDYSITKLNVMATFQYRFSAD